MAAPSRENALDRAVVVVFENRRWNVLRNFLAAIFPLLAPAAPDLGTAT